jgi:hypothetical protein
VFGENYVQATRVDCVDHPVEIAAFTSVPTISRTGNDWY